MTMKIKATTTAIQARAQVFLPIPVKKTANSPTSWIVENKWATIHVKGVLLTQVHRGILDVIFDNYKSNKVFSDGSETYCFTMYDLQTRLGRKSTSNHTWMYERLLEMQTVMFDIRTKPTASGHQRVIEHPVFSIFNSVTKIYDKEKFAKMTPEEQEKAVPIFYEVEFNKKYLRFIETDTYIAYPTLTPKLLSIKCNEAQALARLCLSHKVINYQNLETLMNEIGINEKMMLKSAISRSKGRIIAAKDELEEKLGIKIIVGEKKTDPVKVVYHRDKTLVKFHNDDEEGIRGFKEYNEEIAKEKENNRLMANLDDYMGDLFDDGEL